MKKPSVLFLDNFLFRGSDGSMKTTKDDKEINKKVVLPTEQSF